MGPGHHFNLNSFGSNPFLWLIAGIAFFNPSFGQGTDVLHYKFQLELKDGADTIYGKTQITFRYGADARVFPVDLVMQQANGKGMIVDDVSLNGTQLKNFRKEHGQLVVDLAPRNTNPADSSVIDITYHGVPDDGLIISRNKYGDRTFFADNWPNRAHHWIPCKDQPDDKASFEFMITAPAHYRIISNGRLAEEVLVDGSRKMTHWIEDVVLSTKVMVIGAAEFAVKQFEDSPGNVPVSAWTYPQDTVIGFHNYSVAPAILKFYSDYIGPYPYNKLANVQSKTIFGGMENASAIFYYEESAEEDKSMEDLLAHEIAHQWFGDMASEKNFSHLWLSEGFATYMTDVYLESRYGTDSMNTRLREERASVVEFAARSKNPVVDSVSPLMKLLNANNYQKGGWVLHMLRRTLGDSVFKTFIRTYYDRFKGKNADTYDLEKTAEEVSKKDLRQFFQQWLYTPGIPELDVRWKYNEKEKTITLSITQTQKEGAFHFPLSIGIETATSKQKIATFDIGKQVETFTIGVADPDVRISLDPTTDLLYEGRVEKLKP